MMKFLLIICVYYISLTQNTNVYFGKSFSNDMHLQNNLRFIMNTPYDSLVLVNIINQRLKQDLKQNKIYSKILIQDVSIYEPQESDSIFLNFNIHYIGSNIANIDSVIFTGNLITNKDLLLKEIRFFDQKKHTYSDIKIFSSYLNRSPYIERVNEIRFFNHKQKNLLEIDVIETNTIFINGIFGYNPNEKENQFSSDISLVFENINGTGRALNLQWQKLTSRSNHISVKYSEPWFLDLPIYQTFSLNYQLQDSIFNEISFGTQSLYRISEKFDVTLGVSTKSVVPIDSNIADQYTLPIQKENSVEIGIIYNNLDRRLNSKNGILFNSQLSMNFLNQEEPVWLIQKFNLRKRSQNYLITASLDYYNEIFNENVLYGHIGVHNRLKDEISESDYIYFGGTKQLRGFRENQFKSSEAYFLNFEYRLILNDYSRLFLFSDSGVFKKPYQNKYETRNGIGFGIRFNSKIGIIGIDYGFEGDQLFKDGKIHFGIYGTID